jgi:AraC-like DNA-binding protein
MDHSEWRAACAAAGRGHAMQRFVVSSDVVPHELSEDARFSQWNEFFNANICQIEFSRLQDRPFAAKFEGAFAGSTRFAQFSGTVDHMERTRSIVASEQMEEFVFGMNRSDTRISVIQSGREIALDSGEAVLMDSGQAGAVRSLGGAKWFMIGIPHAELGELVANIHDVAVQPIDQNSPAMRHLRRYLAFLVDADEAEADPPVDAIVRTTLKDLVALSLGARRDAAHFAQMRGLRAARLAEILVALRASFADPACSPASIAARVQLSPAYVQKLLYETGTSLTERVLEMRLQKARAMLAGPAGERTRVTDIAFACGFGDVSYFNRCFRRRFGASPTQFRGVNGP